MKPGRDAGYILFSLIQAINGLYALLDNIFHGMNMHFAFLVRSDVEDKLFRPVKELIHLAGGLEAL